MSVAHTKRTALAVTVCLPNGTNGTRTFALVEEMSDAPAIYLRGDAALTLGVNVADTELPRLSQSSATKGDERRLRLQRLPE